MPDFDEPMIGKIAQSHFGLAIPGRWVVRIDHYVLVIVRIGEIVDPGICGGHRVIRIVCPGR